MDTRTPGHRIEELERKVERLENDIDVASSLPIAIAQAALNRLVDQHRVDGATRDLIWEAVRDELKSCTAGSIRVGDAAKYALPVRRISSNTAAERQDRKPLLRPTRD